MKDPTNIEVFVGCTKKGNLLVKIFLDGEHVRGAEAMNAFAEYIATGEALIERTGADKGGTTHE